MPRTTHALLAILTTTTLILGGGLAHGQNQDYPNRPITLVVPYPPGGPTDTMGRLLALKLAEQVGQDVIVDNKPGAGGNIGTSIVARSKPDGYTLVMGTNGPLAGNLSLVKDMPYDPLKDLAPVTLAFQIPSILVANQSVGAKTPTELIALLKSRPGEYSFSSAGLGTSSHFAGTLFMDQADVNMVHVPYNGDGPSFMGVLSGQTQIFFGSVATAMPHLDSGKIHALAVTSATRVPLLPDLPTLAESGLPGFDLGGWYAIMAPAGTPPNVLSSLNKAMVAVIEDPEVSDRIKSMGGIPIGSTPEELTAFIREEIPKWAAIAEAAKQEGK